MKLGYIGLGKMGENMVARLVERGYRIVVYDKNEEARLMVRREGAEIASSIGELISALRPPRTIWLAVSEEEIDGVTAELIRHLEKGDIVIDGSRSYYEATAKRAKSASRRGVRFLDVGVAGGPSEARSGACLMIGGKKNDFDQLEELFKDLSARGGYLYAGNNGAGHFVRMVHDGLELGMAKILAEGFAVLKKSKYKLPLGRTADLYAHGSAIESRLVKRLSDVYDNLGEQLVGIARLADDAKGAESILRTAKKFGIMIPAIKGAASSAIGPNRNADYSNRILAALFRQAGEEGSADR